VVITSSVDTAWVSSLQQLLYRGIRATVVLVEPESFGGFPGADAIEQKLGELRVPVYRWEQGRPLDQALRQSTLAAATSR
jgi:hypothetical protein